MVNRSAMAVTFAIISCLLSEQNDILRRGPKAGVDCVVFMLVWPNHRELWHAHGTVIRRAKEKASVLACKPLAFKGLYGGAEGN